MTIHKLSVAGALVVAIGGSAAFSAHGAGAFVCQTWNPAKTGRAVTHCITWTREAAARMRAAGCDPAMMNDPAMRARCAELMAEAERNAKRPGGS